MFEPLEVAADVPKAVRFRPAAAPTPEVIAAIAEQVRVLRWFARRRVLTAHLAPASLLPWGNLDVQGCLDFLIRKRARAADPVPEAPWPKAAGSHIHRVR